MANAIDLVNGTQGQVPVLSWKLSLREVKNKNRKRKSKSRLPFFRPKPSLIPLFRGRKDKKVEKIKITFTENNRENVWFSRYFFVPS